jgi:hypothetical protein
VGGAHVADCAFCFGGDAAITKDKNILCRELCSAQTTRTNNFTASCRCACSCHSRFTPVHRDHSHTCRIETLGAHAAEPRFVFGSRLASTEACSPLSRTRGRTYHKPRTQLPGQPSAHSLHSPLLCVFRPVVSRTICLPDQITAVVRFLCLSPRPEPIAVRESDHGFEHGAPLH